MHTIQSIIPKKAVKLETMTLSVTENSLAVPNELAQDHLYVLDYWLRIKDNDIGPSRKDIDPYFLKKALSGITLIEPKKKCDEWQYYFSLSGTDVRNLNNIEISGKSTDVFNLPEYSAVLRRHYNQVMQEKQPTANRIIFTNKRGKKQEYTTLRLPMSTDGIHVDCIMSHDIFCKRWIDLKSFSLE